MRDFNPDWVANQTYRQRYEDNEYYEDRYYEFGDDEEEDDGESDLL